MSVYGCTTEQLKEVKKKADFKSCCGAKQAIYIVYTHMREIKIRCCVPLKWFQ